MSSKKLTLKDRTKIVEKHFGKIPKEKFEPEIYNYCDRWCEKCQKQEKCFLRYLELKEKTKLASDDIDPNSKQAVFDQVKSSLDKTKDLILDITQAEGIDIYMTSEESRAFELERRKTDPSRYKLMKQAKEFFKNSYFFIESLPAHETQDLNDEIEKVSHHAITVVCKVFSAISSKLHAKFEKGADKKFYLHDSFKTACVAYRSAKICRDALYAIDLDVSDYRIKSLIDGCDEILLEIDRNLLRGDNQT